MDEYEQSSPVALPESAPLVTLGALRRQLASVMTIHDNEVLRPPDEVIVFRGQIQGDSEAAFAHIEPAFASLGYTAWLRDRKGGGHEVLAIKGLARARPPRPWLNLVLFLATVVTVLYIGAGYALTDAGLAENLAPEQALWLPLRYLALGVPFAATLLGILLAHELSHYFVSRRYGAPTSLPYFIPMPNLLGTMGAVIVQRGHMRSRRAIFDIGIAGPLGGLVVAIPLLVVGLSLSSVGPIPPNVDTVLQEGNSLLYLGLKYLVFRQILPQNGIDVWLHPVAFAAWAGLLVTMINLIPVGQLDGGHVAYALLGPRAARLGQVLILAMVLWGGYLSLRGDQGGGFWLMWGVLNLFLNRRHPAPLDDATKADGKRVLVGVLMLVLFVLLFMPSPLKQIQVRPGAGPAAWGGLAALGCLLALRWPRRW
jgi:membrane-associated protease RseP (regulator of RpoE activity)